MIKLILETLKKYKAVPLLLAMGELMNLAIFLLYRLELEPFFLSAVFLIVMFILFFVITVMREAKKAEARFRKFTVIGSDWDDEPTELAEQDYRDIIAKIEKEMYRMERQLDEDRTDMVDYYTAWVHQIKTPISVMHMLLAKEDSEQNRALSTELFRVEQYVDMVLQYIRLDAKSNDLVIQEYSLDELLRKSIRKFASQFVGRKIKLEYEGTNISIVTDQKWFAVILEQLLSNAIKYTPSGTVRISVDEDRKLRICDTGIGIAKEDLPRIFEKGYTGQNGRQEQKSSGLGLYLCKKAADKLAISIVAESEPGKGTCFILDFSTEVS